MKRQIKQFVVGAQYYRAPTPLPEEWEYDFKEMGKAGIDTVQFRVQWRWNEPREGEYRFDDLDRLFELSRKYRKNVIFKFLMENAPDYIFNKYSGTRIDLNGQPLRPGANGAFYVGGWLPCFDNPQVRNKAKAFVRTFTQRYKNNDNILAWNIWNEPRTRPIGECCCPHSQKKYQQYLETKFENVEILNEKFGKAWESFETVQPPGSPHDYSELFLWRTWALTAVTDRLSFMYRIVRELDHDRPIVSHVGMCSIYQDIAGDGSDDLENAASVDFYGTSLPVGDHFENVSEDAAPFCICDWLRSVSEYFWVNELYPDWGDWTQPVSVENFRFKIFAILAGGAKGVLYWQYRAERLGYENNLAGLVNMDGSFKDISRESGKIRKIIDKYSDFLMQAEVEDDGIGILYSQSSDMISRIETTGKGLFDFDLVDESYEYKKALSGIYTLFRELGFTVRWLDSRKLGSDFKGIKLLYVPAGYMLTENEVDIITGFVQNGGKLIAEEGFMLRQENTWLNTGFSATKADILFGGGVYERTRRGKSDEKIQYKQYTAPVGGFISRLKNNTGETLTPWANGGAAIIRKGNALLLGTSLGAAYCDSSYSVDIEKLLSELLKEMEIVPSVSSPLPDGIYLRRLKQGSRRMLFVFNRSADKHTFAVDKTFGRFTGSAEGLKILEKEDSLDVELQAKGSAVLVMKIDKTERNDDESN